MMKNNVRIGIFALSVLLRGSQLIAGAAVSEADAVRAIIGEASNQGERGMLAVACAIRNRGTLQGVYGLKAKHVDKQPAWVFDRARKAWAESAKADITGGANHWENVKAFGQPRWAAKMTKTVLVKDHQFYRN